MKMNALQYLDQRNIRLSSVDVPAAEQDEVILRITDSGLCQTQVNEFIEGPFIINHTPRTDNGNQEFLIVGHEFGGIIESVRDDRHADLIGKQAAVLPLVSCGKCDCCENGQENLCENLTYYGLIGKNGGFAEYSCVKRSNLFLVEDKSLLSFIEPLLVAIHAGRMIENDIRGKNICVLGAGTIGLCVACVFRDTFGGRVVIHDLLPGRLSRVKKAGFEVFSDSLPETKFDVVVDSAGNNPTSKFSALVEGFSYLKKNGVLLNLGTYFHPVSVLPAELLISEHRVCGSYLYNYSDIQVLPDVLKAIHVNFSDFITHIQLSNIIEDGYYRAEVDKDSFTRLVVSP